MKAKILITLLSIPFCFVSAQDYSAASIAENMKEGKDAVTRLYEGEFEILAINKATYREKRIVTILNKDGNHNADVAVWYDKLRSVTSLQATKYDEKGNKIERVKKAAFTDESAISGGTFNDDSRILWTDLRQNDFPYTIEFEYEVTYKYLYSIPDWHFIDAYDESVENSRYIVKSPENFKPRFQTINANEPSISTENGKFMATWEEKNLEGIAYEPYSTPLRDKAPRVIASPSLFEFEGYQGDLSTWDGVAAWQNKLNEGRDELSPATIQELKELTAGLNDTEKIQKVYEYVQENTRYVSIQLGIGGFQPFPAKLVDEEGYGDCKALSFYTQSLLKAVGIKSHYTWVFGGNNPPAISSDFPDDTFNHVILCVPQDQDTIWLECTSQTNPFGYLGTFTGDRDVLVITEEGGKVVHTPSYDLKDNIYSSVVDVKLLDNGDAEINFTNSYKGIAYEYRGLDYRLNLGEDKQKEWVEQAINIPSFIVSDFKFTNNKGPIPEAILESTLSVRNLTSQSGTRYFLQPNVMNKNKFIPNKDDNRESQIKTGHAYTDIDTVYFTLPEKYDVEAYFKPILIESDFGTYTASIEKLEDGRIRYCRKYEKLNGLFEPEKYEDYVNFHKQVVRADKKRVSFKKRT